MIAMQQCAATALRVRDLMTANPIAVDVSTTPRELARLLTERAISGVPVVDSSQRVVGVVSRTDLLQWCVKGGLGFGAANLLEALAYGGAGTRMDAVDLGIVADFMTSSPVTASPDEPIRDVARRMRDQRVHRIIVVDGDDRLTGVLTTFDLLRALIPSD